MAALLWTSSSWKPPFQNVPQDGSWHSRWGLSAELTRTVIFLYDWTFEHESKIAVAFLAATSRFYCLPFNLESEPLGLFHTRTFIKLLSSCPIGMWFFFSLPQVPCLLSFKAETTVHWLPRVLNVFHITDASQNPVRMPWPLLQTVQQGWERNAPAIPCSHFSFRSGASCS